MLNTALDLLLVILGFGFIIFVHELGHFLAARWAGIRVLAFAIGFGPPILSYRKGMGLSRASSEPEYVRRLRSATPPPNTAISPTEYRLNLLPFGGYVKMLGQEDANPGAVSDAPDSYQRCVPWKRLVVISAGVVMNVITAAILFVIVFMVGRQVPPPVLGALEPGAPAEAIGLRPGDRVIEVDGRRPLSFDDVALAAAMSERGTPVRMVVERTDPASPSAAPATLTFEPVARRSDLTNLLDLGAAPALTNQLRPALTPEQEKRTLTFLSSSGLAGVAPGMRLVSVGGQPITSIDQVSTLAARSDGTPMQVVFEAADASSPGVTLTLPPRFSLQSAAVPLHRGSYAIATHLLGLPGVMRIADATPDGDGPKASEQGLRTGDIFARIAGVEFPSVIAGMEEIRRSKGSTIAIVVLRPTAGASGETTLEEVTLPAVRVTADGRIGFSVGDTTDASLPPDSPAAGLLASPLREVRFGRDSRPTPASSITYAPGSRLVAVGGREVRTLREAARISSEAASKHESQRQATPLQLELTLAPPPRAGEGLSAAPTDQTRTLTLSVPPADLAPLRALAWTLPIPADLFAPNESKLVAGSPAEALAMGLSETRRIMLTTYLTFARLAQGTIKVEHLKGPVGIAHMGTIIADRGLIWLLFFLALISVNLAVVNFLPLPIVDGGQFLFIVYEWVRGRPVPIAVQNVVTMAGLILLGGMFLLLTFNDVRNLLGI